jgi:hypothetical protein
MMIALLEPPRCPFAHMSVESFAEALKQWSAKVALKRFSSSPIGLRNLLKRTRLTQNILMFLQQEF